MKRLHSCTAMILLLSLMSMTGCDTKPEDIETWKKKGNTGKLIGALNHSKQFIQLESMKALEELNAAEATPALAALFTDSDQIIAHRSIDAAVAIGAPSLEPYILPVLSFETAEARTAAALALGNLKAKSAVQPLIKALNDEHNEVIEAAAVALGKIADPSALPALTEKTGDTKFEVRLAAVNAIGEIGGSAAIPPLASVLGDFSEKLRLVAVTYLIDAGDESIPYALKSLRSPRHTERESAMLILEEISSVPTGGDDVVWHKLAKLTIGERPELDPGKVIELTHLEQPTGALLEAARYEDPVFRQYAVLAMEQIGQPATEAVAAYAEQTLTGEAKDWYEQRSGWPGAPAWQTDLWAGLTALGPTFKINKRMQSILNTRDRKLKNMLSPKTFEIEREMIPQLITIFRSSESEDKDERSMDEACRKLSMVKLKKAGQSAVLPLLASLNDEDLSIAAYSAETLVHIGDPRSHQAVIDAFSKRLENGETLSGTPFHNAMLKLELPGVDELLLKVRPNDVEALKTVHEKYPGIKFSNIPLQFDVDPGTQAAPFRMKYLKDGKSAELKVVFRPDENGNWLPAPPLPDDLG